MKKLKIGILTEIINYHSGARAPLLIAKHLVAFGHPVTVFAYDFMLDKFTYNDLKNNGVHMVLVSRKKIPYLGKYIASISLYKIIKNNYYDCLLYSGTLPFFLVAKATGISIVRMYQGTQFDALLENKIPGETISIVEKILNNIANTYIYFNDFIAYRFSDKVVAISKYAAREGEKLYKRKCDKVIYNGTSFLPSIKKESIKQKKTIEILSVSRITPYKGFHIILEAIKQLKTKKRINMTIVGSQPKMRYVEYLRKVGGNNVQIILNPTDKELAKLYARSDFYVTADRYLYFGLPIYEAAYFGKPTVSLNNAAAPEIINHGKTGYIADTIDQLIYFISLLANNLQLRRSLGMKAKKNALNATWGKCALQWEKMLKVYKN